MGDGTQDIIEHWSKLVPEVDSKAVLNECIIAAVGKGIDDLADHMINQQNEHPAISMDPFREIKHNNYKHLVSEFKSVIPFYYFYEPFVFDGLDRWVFPIQTLNLIKDMDPFLQGVIYPLLIELSNYASSTFYLEVNVALKHNKLIGHTEKEQFEYYHYEYLKDKEYSSKLSSEYRALKRILSERVNSYFEYIFEILCNIQRDIRKISLTFQKGLDALKVQGIKTGIGIQHHRGKTVATIEFIDDFKLVYKPNNMGMDTEYQRVLHWYEENGRHRILPIRKIKIMSQEDYGLAEYIDKKECDSIKEVQDFYTKLGQQVALLYSLNAFSLQDANIIANGSDPVFIDLDILFHPYAIFRETFFALDFQHLKSIDTDQFVQSIGRLPCLSKEGTMSDKVGECYPVLNGKIQGLDNYIDQLLLGFKAAYHVILENKDRYSNWIWSRFARCMKRILLKPLKEYRDLLNASYHPDLLRCEEDRVVFFSKVFADSEEKKRRLIKLEFDALQKSEVPIFYCRLNSRDLYDANEIVHYNFFEMTPQELVQRRVMLFSEENLTDLVKAMGIELIETNNAISKPIGSIFDYKAKPDR